MKIQHRPGFAPGIAPHFARRRTSSGCIRRRAAASASESVRRGTAAAVRSIDADLVMFDSRWFGGAAFRQQTGGPCTLRSLHPDGLALGVRGPSRRSRRALPTTLPVPCCWLLGCPLWITFVIGDLLVVLFLLRVHILHRFFAAHALLYAGRARVF